MQRERDQNREILDRLRRMETRLTSFLAAQGHVMTAEQPKFLDGVITVPSPRCALADVVAAIPEGWRTEDIEVRAANGSLLCGVVALTEDDLTT